MKISRLQRSIAMCSTQFEFQRAFACDVIELHINWNFVIKTIFLGYTN